MSLQVDSGGAQARAHTNTGCDYHNTIPSTCRTQHHRENTVVAAACCMSAQLYKAAGRRKEVDDATASNIHIRHAYISHQRISAALSSTGRHPPAHECASSSAAAEGVPCVVYTTDLTIHGPKNASSRVVAGFESFERDPERVPLIQHQAHARRSQDQAHSILPLFVNVYINIGENA